MVMRHEFEKIIEFDVGKQTVSDNNFNCMFELLTKGSSQRETQ